MEENRYMPGYGTAILDFFRQRTADTHGAFFLPHLSAGLRVLDAGCGPGSITLGLARKIAPGQVTGVDIEGSQFAKAAEQARHEGLNVEFRVASVYDLPFPSHSFDAVFSHAVMSHLSDPPAALREFHRVLKPGGVAGVRAGDLGGLLIDAESDAPARGFEAYIEQQRKNGGDPQVGRKIGRLLRAAGFDVLRFGATYEVISDGAHNFASLAAPPFMPEFADSATGASASTEQLFIALPWCEVVGRAC
jgi:ubiquinone/menaquinone biosynthesis C-methylase UbiE